MGEVPPVVVAASYINLVFVDLSITVYHLSSLADQVLVRATHYRDGTKENEDLRVIKTSTLNVYLNAHLRLIGLRQPSSPSQQKTSTKLICSLGSKTISFSFWHLVN